MTPRERYKAACTELLYVTKAAWVRWEDAEIDCRLSWGQASERLPVPPHRRSPRTQRLPGHVLPVHSESGADVRRGAKTRDEYLADFVDAWQNMPRDAAPAIWDAAPDVYFTAAWLCAHETAKRDIDRTTRK